MSKPRLVVIGNGMVGARLVEEVLERGGRDRFEIVVFGDEPHGNYNRILLSGVLAGTYNPKDIFINPASWYPANKVVLHAGVRVDAINTQSKEVRGANGCVERYDTLVIATGSSPLVPRMEGLYREPGRFKDGVFVFRTLEDCSGIVNYAGRAKHAAVIGGGLLGLEAARGLLNLGVEVHVVHLMSHLMEAQLDEQASAILLRQLLDMGLHVHFGKTTSAVLGEERVTGLAFDDSSMLPCDLVVVSAGIRPNVELAVRAGIVVERGIVVSDDLSVQGAPDVYAIGECAQHRGRVYGLVAPLWEQAECLAQRLVGRSPLPFYEGSRTSTKLKIMGVDLAVMGEKEAAHEDDEVISYAEPTRGIYKKLIVRNNRLAGAIVIGDGAVVPSLLQAFADGNELSDNRAELLFPFAESGSKSPISSPAVDRMPDAARVCDCNGVSKAQIVEAVLGGARSLQTVCALTRAGTGCGSCKPEVQAILAATCEQLAASELESAPPPAPGIARIERASASMNKIERYKQERAGLDVLEQLPAFAREGWESISDGDRERLKWTGVFFRKQTPGRFMMRIRIPNGLSTSLQFRVIAGISRDVGAGFVDITTRQQIQLRGFEIGDVEAMWRRLEAVGLCSLQTGMDNVRNVVGCAAAGLTPHELFDASPVARQFTEMFLRNKEYTDLPRKLNVAITGCRENCTHTDTQDIALTPAMRTLDGHEVMGFNVAVGGKMGSGGYRMATPLDVFVPPLDGAEICAQLTLIFRDHGSRAARSKSRLAFLVDEWGIEKLRCELQRRSAFQLATAGQDERTSKTADHIGIFAQKQAGLSAVGLTVPVGRITLDQLLDVARVADTFGNGDIRITTAQNLIVPNVPNERVHALTGDPLLKELSHEPSGAMRGLVSCTGIDYCHLALVETKELAMKTARHLENTFGRSKPLTMHWSGCPAGCANHAAADVGLLGKNIRVNGTVIEAVDVFVGGGSGPNARPGTKVLEDIPCEDLPQVLERMIPYLSIKRQSTKAKTLSDASV
jgi:NAD(P)H-nitrite reductase large subunit